MVHRRVKIGLLLLGLLVAGGTATWLASRRHIARFYAFGGYSNAISYYYLHNERIPKTVEEIEQDYNNWDSRHTVLPSPPWFLRPTFRPLGSLRGGPYLLFIETKPSGLQDWTRYVIYADGHGSKVRLESVWEWELDELIREDDERRSAAQRDPDDE